MLYFNAKPRDGSHHSDCGCNTCCCEKFTLRPGETNSLMINYAPWSLPYGCPGIVKATSAHVERISKTCAEGKIDGFQHPRNSSYRVAERECKPVEFNLCDHAAPRGNDFVFSLVPLSGPGCGMAEISQDGCVVYTPHAGFAGYDYFSYKMTDPQGREVVRTIEMKIGEAFNPSPWLMADRPYLHIANAVYNQAAQTVHIPIYMPRNTPMCESFRMTIQQRAMDCHGNCYEHPMCFDIYPGEC